MLFLLVKTQLRHSLNYVRDKFDAVSFVYMALIGVLLLYMLGRSPSDIGYGTDFLRRSSFARDWMRLLIHGLPVWYLFSLASGMFVLRRTARISLLTTLPVPQQILVQYTMLLLFLRLAVPILLLSLPFALASMPAGRGILFAAAAGGGLVSLCPLAFLRAAALHAGRTHATASRLRPWLVEFSLLAVLYLLSHPAAAIADVWHTWPRLAAFSAVLLAGAAYRLTRITCGRLGLPVAGETPVLFSGRSLFTPSFSRSGRIATLLQHDLLYVLRHKKSVIVIQFITAAMALMIAGTTDTPQSALGGILFVSGLIGLVLVNLLMALFERDAVHLPLMRALPVSARALWLARWVFLFLGCALPQVLPVLLVGLTDALDLTAALLAAASILLVPGALALIACNAGFGAFPHVKYATNLMNIAFALVFLFWFYVPFGSALLLAVTLLWVRKAQRHYKFLEIE